MSTLLRPAGGRIPEPFEWLAPGTAPDQDIEVTALAEAPAEPVTVAVQRAGAQS